MITKASNQVILQQIATLFYPTNRIGYANLIARFNSYLSDIIFEQILSNLTYGKFYHVSWIKNTPNNQGTFDITFKAVDLFKGNAFNIIVNGITWDKSNDLNFVLSHSNYDWMGSILFGGVRKDILHDLNVEGYGITYDPLGGTQGGSGTGGSGTVTVTPLPSPPQKEITTQTSSIFGNLDLNSLLLPGVILLAGYFLIKK